MPLDRPALLNPNLAAQGALYRQNMTPPTSVMDPRWQAYAQAQNQADALMALSAFPGPGELATAGKALGALAAKNVLGVPALTGIVSPNVARLLSTKRELPNTELFQSAVANTPGAAVVDDGLQMRLMRNQKPDQNDMPSVRGGVFYLPDGAQQAKHYSTGKNGYGGTDRITGETLINNPLFVKGATGGKAPEGAFDLLNGKGAYQQMRSDALDVNWGRRTGGGTDIESFLEKYAPELKGQGQYILENSKEGNQLAYALQEAAVASAARRAGHDAVIGYSTARSTKQPFISEVFDVREKNYPDKGGAPSEVWESFRK
jgi:hypothetical protein